MKKKYSLIIKGKEHTWSFDVDLEEKYIDTYRKDGIHIDEVLNTVPIWAAELGLTKVWFFWQDVFNFRNPFK